MIRSPMISRSSCWMIAIVGIRSGQAACARCICFARASLSAAPRTSPARTGTRLSDRQAPAPPCARGPTGASSAPRKNWPKISVRTHWRTFSMPLIIAKRLRWVDSGHHRDSGAQPLYSEQRNFPRPKCSLLDSPAKNLIAAMRQRSFCCQVESISNVCMVTFWRGVWV